MADESNRVPKARLSQIAARKLSGLGIPHRLKGDGETLEGELPLSGAVLHPATGAPLKGAGFVLIGHDRLGFLEPPLSGLGPVSYYDAESAQAVEGRVAQALAQRLSGLKAVAERMKALKVEPTLDVERLLVQGRVKAGTHVFEILGGPEGCRVARVTPPGAKPFEVARAAGLLELDGFATHADLEAFLGAGDWKPEEARPGAAAPPKAAAPAREPLKALAPPAVALTTLALQRLGDGAVVTYSGKLELTQEFLVDGALYRFTALHERGTTFSGKLVGPSGEKWSDHFDANRCPGIPALVSDILKIPLPAPPAAPGEESAEEAELVPERLVPHPGEIWIMNVLLEQEGNGEVRYVGTDVEGKPYGAPRILKRADFEAVFTQLRGAWCLRVRVEGREGDTVTYRQLDPAGQPRGAVKAVALSIFAATFVPEP